jgi:hypothetical protein
MRFAQNRMYIESYNKCPNCGILLYEKPANSGSSVVVAAGKTYCSSWCVEWEADRGKREAADVESR